MRETRRPDPVEFRRFVVAATRPRFAAALHHVAAAAQADRALELTPGYVRKWGVDHGDSGIDSATRRRA
jgi:hypothetical protein